MSEEQKTKFTDLISSLKDIIYIVVIIVTVVLAYSALDKRITILESSTVTKEQLYMKLDEIRSSVQALKEEMRGMNLAR